VIPQGIAAASFQVSGVHGFALIIALLLFIAAGIIAWFVSPRTYWATFVAAGLALVTLSMLVTG
jgi:hypothetical protein